MPPVLDARFALFPTAEKGWAAVDSPMGGNAVPADLAAWFDEAPAMATVQWGAPVDAGLPVIPYDLKDVSSIAGDSLAVKKVSNGPIALGQPGGWTYAIPVYANYLQDLAPGLLYLAGRVKGAADGAQIYALDAQGLELPDSRVAMMTGEAFALTGPGIFGLGATAPTEVTDVVGGRLDLTPDQWSEIAQAAPLIAQVAPFFDVDGLFGDLHIGPRTYAERDAFHIRLKLDAIARNATAAPGHVDLESEVHRRDPKHVAKNLLANTMLAQLANDYFGFAADPSRLLSEIFTQPDGKQVPFQQAPAALLQLAGQFGPVEATTLGGSISVPAPRAFSTNSELAEALLALQGYPLPLLFVDAGFAPVGMQAADHEKLKEHALSARRVARLVWPAQLLPFRAGAIGTYPPPERDAQATADVRIALNRSSRYSTAFIERQLGDATSTLLTGADGQPDQKFVGRIVPPDDPDYDRAVFDPGQLLPYEQSITQGYKLHVRDPFGRWPDAVSGDVVLDPWPVQRPSILTLRPRVAADGLWVDIDLAWDWARRSPAAIRFGMAIVAAADSEPSAKNLKDNHLDLPVCGGNQVLEIVFAGIDPDERPQINAPGWPAAEPVPTVELVPPVPAEKDDPTVGDETRTLLRQYRLRLKIGSAEGVFSGKSEAQEIVVTCTGTERVSGGRESKPTDLVLAPLADPRPPQVSHPAAALRWTARPDVEGLARAHVPLPDVNGEHLTFHLWRCHETSLFDFLAPHVSGADVVFTELKKSPPSKARLQLLLNVARSVRGKVPGFDAQVARLFEAANATKDPGISDDASEGFELALPADQMGFEFAFVTATNGASVSSKKPSIFNALVYAVPRPERLRRPVLVALHGDEAGILTASGSMVAAICFDQPFGAATISLLWEHAGRMRDAESFFFPALAVTEISQDELGYYLSDPAKIIGALPKLYHRFILVTMQEDWQARDYCAELVWNGESPAEQAVSPRSNIVRAERAPANGPALGAHIIGPQKWGIEMSDLPMVDTAFGASALGVAMRDHLSDHLEVYEYAPDDLPFTIGQGTMRLTVEIDPASGWLIVIAEHDLLEGLSELVVWCRDPIGRAARSVLK